MEGSGRYEARDPGGSKQVRVVVGGSGRRRCGSGRERCAKIEWSGHLSGMTGRLIWCAKTIMYFLNDRDVNCKLM